MEPDKQRMAASVSNQQALVKAIIQSKTRKPTRTFVPGGANMLDQIDKATLEHAMFTYLKRHRWFDWFKFSFHADPDSLELVETKVRDFPEPEGATGVNLWDVPSKGKKWLAGQCAEILLEDRFVTMTVKPDGIYVTKERTTSDFGPGSEGWLPHYDVMPANRGEYSIRR